MDRTPSDPVVELTSRLVATPSPNLPGDERAVAGLVQDMLVELGLPRAEVIAKAPDRPNLSVTIDLGPGGRHLCLSGHLDTKPIGSAKWATNPMVPTIDGDRMYGLGTCDMKGAIAAMLLAAADVAAQGTSAGRLTLLFTADEENGAAFGARYLAEQGAVDADVVLIGEPGGVTDDWDALQLVSRGIANIWIDVSGDQGHSSLSDVRNPVSATQEMSWLLLRFAERFQPSYPAHPLSATGPTVNAGVKVEGGVGFGVVPGSASFAIDVRLLPGMQREQFERELQEFLDACVAERPTLRPTVRFEAAPRDWLPPTEVHASHPLVPIARSAMADVLGSEPPLGVFPGTTDAAWIQGLSGIPTLPACGPGLIARAHGADEFVSVKALIEARGIYERIARAYCAGEGAKP